MKRLSVLILLPFFLGALETGGFLEIGKTSFTGLDDSPYYPIYNTLRIENHLGEGDMRGMVSFDLRFFDFGSENTISDLCYVNLLYPIQVNLYEAYFEITGFILDNLDMKVGKQRIAWGTADKFNPTDNLNPLDLSNPFNFGERLPSMAVQANYYIKDWTFTGVVLPVFTPSLLPADTLVLPSSITGTLNMPEFKPRNLSYGVKIGSNIFNFDVSLSYFYGYDPFPIPDSMGAVTGITYGFDRERVFGADFAGEVKGVGLWGEFGYVAPEKYGLAIKTPVYDSLGNPVGTASIDTCFLKDPYYRLTIGFDYTLPWEIYINTQYIHGMPFERKEMITQTGTITGIGDYIFGRIEKKFLEGDLKFSLGYAGEVREDSLAYGIVPEIEYHPVDNAKISAGFFQTWGSKTTFLGRMKDLKMAYILFRFDF